MKTKQQKAADRWERLIRRECAALHESGRARVDKNWEAPKVPGTHIPREKSKPDFSGFLCRGGKHVVFDAKTTEEVTRFDFSNVKDHQWQHLLEADAAGAISFIYLLSGDGRRWVLPMRACREAAAVRSSILLVDEMEQLGEWERRGASFVWRGEDWLGTLQRVGLSTEETP